MKTSTLLLLAAAGYALYIHNQPPTPAGRISIGPGLALTGLVVAGGYYLVKGK